MACEKCGCEDYFEYKDTESGEWKRACLNCEAEMERIEDKDLKK